MQVSWEGETETAGARATSAPGSAAKEHVKEKARLNPLPNIVIAVPPVSGPVRGDREFTRHGARYRKILKVGSTEPPNDFPPSIDMKIATSPGSVRAGAEHRTTFDDANVTSTVYSSPKRHSTGPVRLTKPEPSTWNTVGRDGWSVESEYTYID